MKGVGVAVPAALVHHRRRLCNWRAASLEPVEPGRPRLPAGSIVDWRNHSASGVAVPAALVHHHLLPTSRLKRRRISGPASADLLWLLTAPPERLMREPQGQNC